MGQSAICNSPAFARHDLDQAAILRGHGIRLIGRRRDGFRMGKNGGKTLKNHGFPSFLFLFLQSSKKWKGWKADIKAPHEGLGCSSRFLGLFPDVCDQVWQITCRARNSEAKCLRKKEACNALHVRSMSFSIFPCPVSITSSLSVFVFIFSQSNYYNEHI